MRETGISYEHLWLTVVRAVSDAEKTEGKPLPGHPPQGGESRRGKSKQEEQTTCPSIHPSFFWKEQEEAKRAGGSLRTRRETSLTWLGHHHAVGITFPQTEGWMHSPLLLPPQKDQGKAFHVPLPQASASDEHQEEDLGWKQTPLFFPFFPFSCRAEQVGRCRRRGGIRAPESTHTTAKVAPIVKGKGKPIWGVGCMGHPPPPQLCLKHLPGMTFHLSFSPSLCGHLDQQLPQGQ